MTDTEHPRIVAIVPMRHSSERVPGKNYRPLAGKPLYHHIIDTLLKVTSIAEVVIDTDSDLILEDAGDRFPSVTLMRRPEHLRDGHISMNEILRNDLDRVPADLYLQTHSTNPLLRAETLSRAIDAFERAGDSRDSLFGVTRLQTRLWTHDGHPMNHDPAVLLRTQDLPPVYEENSCMYLFPPQLLRERRTRIGANPLLFEVPREEAWDIDEEVDFDMVSAVLAWRDRP